MANLPMDRTKLQAAISNQQPSITASAQANREAHVEAANTIDLLYQFVSGMVAGGTLSPYPFGANRQAIINGGFSVNQRVKTGTVILTAGQYGHDRWKAGASGCTYTFATVNNVTTITITAGSMMQVIEGIHLYSGTYTLTWTGSAQGKIGAGSYGATGITGTIVGGTTTVIEFSAGTLSNVQFNFGSSAVPFQPRSFAEELALCERYYEKTYNFSTSPGAATSTGSAQYLAQNAVAASTAGGLAIGLYDFRVPKRTTPTVTLYSPSGVANAVRVAYGSDRTGASISPAENGFNAINFNNTSATAIASGNAIEFQYTVESEL